MGQECKKSLTLTHASPIMKGQKAGGILMKHENLDKKTLIFIYEPTIVWTRARKNLRTFVRTSCVGFVCERLIVCVCDINALKSVYESKLDNTRITHERLIINVQGSEHEELTMS